MACVALVNVPYGKSGNSMRPLGLAALGAFAEQRNVDVTGFDFSDSTSSADCLIREFGLADFAVVGLSFYNMNAPLAFEFARRLREASAKVKIVAGGPHASALPARILERHPEIDVVVRNEGEEAFVELLAHLGDRASLIDVPGIAFREPHSGATTVTSDRGRIVDLDALPAPAFHFRSETGDKPLLFHDRVGGTLRRAAALVTSRSCPFSCAFCAIILIGRKWRRSSASKVLSDFVEIEAHAGARYEHVYFMDANFFVDARRSLEIAEVLHRARPEVTFSFSTRVNQLLRGADVLPELKRLGLRAVELGIESGSEAALERFAKGTHVAQNLEAVELLRRHNVQLILDFIMFDAEASVGDLAANVGFLENAQLDAYAPWDHLFSCMTPYIGTAIRSRYESICSTAFDDDELPLPQALLCDGAVRAVYEQMMRLLVSVPTMQARLERIEEGLSLEWSREAARHRLNAVTLRRFPYIVLRSLVRQALHNEPILLETALPPFVDDVGTPVSLSEFMGHALH